MKENPLQAAIAWIRHTGLYIQALAKWLALAIVVGAACGVVGSAFHIGVEKATELRGEFPWLLWCLPAAGLLIVAFYRLTRTEGLGTNDIIDAVHLGKGLTLKLLPAVFFGTVLTHLCGGSAGREGAALQMGGTIGHKVGGLFRLDDRDMRTATMAGMAAFFAALFGTPLTAAVFAMEVVSVGIMYYAAIVPCLVSASVGLLVAQGFGLHLEGGYQVGECAVLAPDSMLRVAVLGILCALVSILFCRVMHAAPKLYARFFPGTLLRVTVGGLLVLVLTVLVGDQTYNGAGEAVMHRMIGGETIPEAFLLKILFTALTLGAGFRGGEIVPVLFTGCAFGTLAGPMLGLPHGFSGALGMAAVFCGATNCPMSSILLSYELFGGEGLPLYALCVGVSYMLSGYYGLYGEQKIVYSKFKTEWIDRKAD